MKKYPILLFMLLQFSLIWAQSYKPVAEKSTVTFKVSHQIIFKSTVTGSFQGLKGAIVFDPGHLSESSVDVSVDARTINTGIKMRDNDLKKEKYFDVEQYNSISIRSKEIIKGYAENEYYLSALLTMKGKTLPVRFPFTASRQGNACLFKGKFHVNRLQFNVGPDNSIDKDVEIELTVLAQ